MKEPPIASATMRVLTSPLARSPMNGPEDGAWAQYTVAQAFGLTRVPDNVALEQAAILADAEL